MTRDLEQDREAFRRHVAESDRLAETGDADAANAETGRLEQLAEAWQADGREVQFLGPLLDEGEPRAVRFNAASWLLHKGHAETAIPVLEAIRQGAGIEALHAGLLLDDWRAEQNAHRKP